MSERFKETSTIRSATRRLLLSEKLGAALRGESTPQPATMPSRREPLTEQTRGTQKQRILGRPGTSAPLLRQAYGTPRDVAPAHGAKHRKVRFLEDFNCDGSGVANIHDLIANGISKTDPDAKLNLRLMSREARDGKGLEDPGHRNRDPWAKAKTFLAMLEPMAATSPTAEPEPAKPAPTNRELQQRLSKRQRLIMRAFRLTQQGIAWDSIAKGLGITRSEARGMRKLVTSMLGRAIAKRPRDQKRDDVGQFKKTENMRIPSKNAAIVRLSA